MGDRLSMDVALTSHLFGVTWRPLGNASVATVPSRRTAVCRGVARPGHNRDGCALLIASLGTEACPFCFWPPRQPAPNGICRLDSDCNQRVLVLQSQPAGRIAAAHSCWLAR